MTTDLKLPTFTKGLPTEYPTDPVCYFNSERLGADILEGLSSARIHFNHGNRVAGIAVLEAMEFTFRTQMRVARSMEQKFICPNDEGDLRKRDWAKANLLLTEFATLVHEVRTGMKELPDALH